MLICSDGIWEFMNNFEVRDLGNLYYQKGQIIPFCNDLIQKTVQRWDNYSNYRDDITVVCVFF